VGRCQANPRTITPTAANTASSGWNPIQASSLEEETMAGKFLVLWKLSRTTPDVVRAVLRQQDYGARLLAEGKLEGRYHLVGGHGGA
jgi:hypothetical protein